MDILVSLIVGVVIGWVASLRMATDSREGLIRNIAIAIAGAYVGGWLLSALLDPVDQGGVSFDGILASSLGAITLLFLVTRLGRV